MAKEKALLILGPSFRRKTGKELTALERFDGLFFRVAKKYLKTIKDVNVVVMLDDLTLVDGSAHSPYTEPEGTKWGRKIIMKNMVKEAVEKIETTSQLSLKAKNIRRFLWRWEKNMQQPYQT